MAGALPNLVVIGAMKAGTSALHYYLDLHPEVSMSRPKELDFFVDGRIAQREDWTFGPDDLRVERTLVANWSRGLDWYARQFDADAPVRGEASPSYTSPWYMDVAERMARVVPEAKLVFLVRDPVERAISNYLHQRSVGRDRRDLEQALGDRRSPYVARSRYALALEPFLRLFSREQLLVITQDELRERRRETVSAVYRFAGVDPSFWSQKAERERYEGKVLGPLGGLRRRPRARAVARRIPDEARWWLERGLTIRRGPAPPRPSQGLRARLRAYLRDDVERLAELTGRSYPDWSMSE